MPVGLYNENAGAAYYSLGSHHTLRITGGAAAGSVLELALEAYAGHFCAGCMPADRETRRPEDFLRTYRGLTVCTRREDVLAFVMDLRTLLQLAECLPETSFRRAKVRATLVEVVPHAGAHARRAGGGSLAGQPCAGPRHHGRAPLP